jgi:hypothetical protein
MNLSCRSATVGLLLLSTFTGFAVAPAFARGGSETAERLDAETGGAWASADPAPAADAGAALTYRRFLPALAAGTPALGPAPVQGVPMSQIHPQGMVSYRFSYGKEDFGVDNGTTLSKGNEFAMSHSLAGEYFFQNQLGAYFGADFGYGDKTNLASGFDVRVDSTLLFLALSYRATVDDYFRMPVRFGPYIHRATVKVYDAGNVYYSTLGVRLSVAPEFVFFQHVDQGRISELSAFVELSVGAGPSHVRDSTSTGRGHASNIGAEIGLRYKFTSGFFVGLSCVYRDQEYGSTTNHVGGVTFFPTTDKFLGGGLTLGWRF